MKVEIGQVRQYGYSKGYFTITSSYQPVSDLCEILHEDGFTADNVPLEDIQRGSILISTHPTFYDAIAEMGRLAEAKGLI